MSEIRCDGCGEAFEGRTVPACPACQAARWAATPRLVREKHDPGVSGGLLDSYRSILTPHTKSVLPRVLDYAARHGRWFHDRDYAMWVHVTPLPLGRIPGVGIPAGRDSADHGLDCLFIAEADDPAEAHVFAADGERHEAQVRAGVFQPLGGCEVPGCENLTRPARARCALHEPSC